jgi:hypothetical protein
VKANNLLKISWKDWNLSEKTTKHHLICGRHTGIPECCIRWFNGPWTIISSISYLREAYWQENDKHVNVDYVRCPACIHDLNIVQIKVCDCYEGR